MAGVAIGGGDGWLAGNWGMTCDNPIAAEGTLIRIALFTNWGRFGSCRKTAHESHQWRPAGPYRRGASVNWEAHRGAEQQQSAR
jgi:hypothetical protein